MQGFCKIAGLALLSAGFLAAGLAPKLRAATTATSDILSDDRAPSAAGSVDVGSMRPLARPAPDNAKALPSGNPLWAVPLSVLTATRDRPIFSISRRPPQPAVVAPQAARAAAVPQKVAEPEHSSLSLLGAVVGESEAIAVFLDRTDQKVVRLRQGDTHAGWVLSAVGRREVTLKKADRTEVLALRRPDDPAGPGASTLPPAATGFDTSYAPFTPRSTPKKGEPDGL